MYSPPPGVDPELCAYKTCRVNEPPAKGKKKSKKWDVKCQKCWRFFHTECADEDWRAVHESGQLIDTEAFTCSVCVPTRKFEDTSFFVLFYRL